MLGAMLVAFTGSLAGALVGGVLGRIVGVKLHQSSLGVIGGGAVLGLVVQAWLHDADATLAGARVGALVGLIAGPVVFFAVSLHWRMWRRIGVDSRRRDATCDYGRRSFFIRSIISKTAGQASALLAWLLVLDQKTSWSVYGYFQHVSGLTS